MSEETVMRPVDEIEAELVRVRAMAYACLSEHDDRSVHLGSLMALAWVLGPERQRAEIKALGVEATKVCDSIQLGYAMASVVGSGLDPDYPRS